MAEKIARRDFLKAVPAAAGMLATAAPAPVPLKVFSARQAELKLSGAAYVPNADYPRQAKRFSEVTIRDDFWRPKIMTNAEVTIPFEIQQILRVRATHRQQRPGSGHLLAANAPGRGIAGPGRCPDPRDPGRPGSAGQRTATVSSRWPRPSSPRRGGEICWMSAIRSADLIYDAYRSAPLRSRAASATPSTASSSIGRPAKSGTWTWRSTISISAERRIR